MKHTKTLRNLVNSKQIIIAPGVFDGLSGLLAKQAGFKVLYASGGAIARSTGYPDIGLLTLTEVSAALSHIVNVTELPIIADADTGFGNAVNAARTIKTFERIGVAGLHLEDQTFPKRCGHLEGKSVVSIDEMCHKLYVAQQSKMDPDFMIIARTDAIGAEGFDMAIKRAKAYQDAGADMIFVEAPVSVEQIKSIASEIKIPKLLNMFHSGKTPIMEIDELQTLGYNVIIIPSDLQRASIKAMQNSLSAIKLTGNSSSIADDMVSFKQREEIVETAKYLAI